VKREIGFTARLSSSRLSPATAAQITHAIRDPR
jgi:hypothetical protein